MTRDDALAFLSANRNAVMVTIGGGGQPHAVPVLYALDGSTVLISGTEGRARTRNVRRDPRCTVIAFEEGSWWKWVTVEGSCEIRTENAAEENARLYEMITGKPPDDPEEYREAMVRERRLVYAVSVDRWYPST